MLSAVSSTNNSASSLPSLIPLANFLNRFGKTSDISRKIRHYELRDRQVATIKEIEEKYIPLVKNNKAYYMYVQDGFLDGEGTVRGWFRNTKCGHILLPKCEVDLPKCRFLYIIPQYKEYCRQTLRPFVKTVMRQLFKALVFLHNEYLIHARIGPDCITWRWNKVTGKPHVYLKHFCKVDVPEITTSLQYDRWYDFCEYDVRCAGILMLEMLLDQDIRCKHYEALIPEHDLSQYLSHIECHVTRSLLLALIGGDPYGRISVEQALKHKYFR